MHTPLGDAPLEEEAITPVKLLVCVDRSPVSHIALRFACSKARKAIRRGGVVDILYVLPPSELSGIAVMGNQLRKEQREEAEALLAEMAEEARHWAGIIPSLMLREGQVGEEIIKAALEDEGVNMLVLGANPESAGRGKLLSWLAGQLGHKLKIPLLIVPGTMTDDEIWELS